MTHYEENSLFRFYAWISDNDDDGVPWLMVTISAKIVGTKAKEARDPNERMQIESVLYHPEPITFLK